jgi:hypothetical protein
MWLGIAVTSIPLFHATNLCLQAIVCAMQEVCTRLSVKGITTANNFPLPSINYLGITHMFMYKNFTSSLK